MTAAELEAIEKLCEAAMRGEWLVNPAEFFIGEVPKLLAEVKRLREVADNQALALNNCHDAQLKLRADLKAYDDREVDRCAAYAKSNATLMVENNALKLDAAWYRLVCNRIGRDTLTDRAYCDIDAAVCALDDHGVKPGDFDERIRELINMYEAAEMSRVELAAKNETLRAEMARLMLATERSYCNNCGNDFAQADRMPNGGCPICTSGPSCVVAASARKEGP